MVDWNPKLVGTLAAVVAVLAVLGFALHFTGGTGATGRAASGNGACVIIPNQKAPVESLGKGLVNADHVCDAATNGCDYCLAQCELFNKIVDKYGCPALPVVSGKVKYKMGSTYAPASEIQAVCSGDVTCIVHPDGIMEFSVPACPQEGPACENKVSFLWMSSSPQTAGTEVNYEFLELSGQNNIAAPYFGTSYLQVIYNTPDGWPTDPSTLMLLSNAVQGSNIKYTSADYTSGWHMGFTLKSSY